MAKEQIDKVNLAHPKLLGCPAAGHLTLPKQLDERKLLQVTRRVLGCWGQEPHDALGEIDGERTRL
jgi:hypothetical protein